MLWGRLVSALSPAERDTFLCRASGFSANVTSLTLRSFAKSGWSVWNAAPSVFTRCSAGLDGEQHSTGLHAPLFQNHLFLFLPLFIYLFFAFFPPVVSSSWGKKKKKKLACNSSTLSACYLSVFTQIWFCRRMGGSAQSSDITSALKIKLVIYQGCLLREGEGSLYDDWEG